MKAKYLTCPSCGGQHMTLARRRFEYDWVRKYLVVIENVPMQVCEDCDDGIMTHEVARQLDMLAQPIILQYRRKRKLPRPLAVIDYKAVFKRKPKREPAHAA